MTHKVVNNQRKWNEILSILFISVSEQKNKKISFSRCETAPNNKTDCHLYGFFLFQKKCHLNCIEFVIAMIYARLFSFIVVAQTAEKNIVCASSQAPFAATTWAQNKANVILAMITMCSTRNNNGTHAYTPILSNSAWFASSKLPLK